jgi:glutamine synthetase
MLALDELAKHDYDTIIIASTDVQGRIFGRRIPLRRFLENPSEGTDICTCALVWDITENLSQSVPFAGYHTGWHDFHLQPDLQTLRPYPGVTGTAIVMADIVDEHGDLLEIAPRTILRRQVERAQEHGFQVALATELEFYLFRGDARTARLHRFQDLEPSTLVRSDYSIVGQAGQEPFIRRIRQEMEAADIPILACQAEYGLGQWEVNFEHTNALEMADRHVIYKAGIKEMALQEGLTLTFMAKPVATDMGSSCHIHCSLHTNDMPVFPAESGSHHPSDLARHFIGGQMQHLNESALFFASYVNSYKRHASEDFGGGINRWGFDNRTVAFRVVGAGPSLHLEHRYPGADVNPYLAAAAVIAAGLDGIDRDIDPGSPFVGNAYVATDLPRTPVSLGEALQVFEASEFIASSFGQDIVRHYAAHARGEWLGYLNTVTDWELIRAFDLA